MKYRKLTRDGSAFLFYGQVKFSFTLHPLALRALPLNLYFTPPRPSGTPPLQGEKIYI